MRWTFTELAVVIILQYIQVLYHNVVHLKANLMSYVYYTSIFKNLIWMLLERYPLMAVLTSYIWSLCSLLLTQSVSTVHTGCLALTCFAVGGTDAVFQQWPSSPYLCLYNCVHSRLLFLFVCFFYWNTKGVLKIIWTTLALTLLF